MIESILDSGIEMVLYFQSLGDWIFAPMESFTFLGTIDFYLLILPIIFWSIDASLGLRIGIILTFSWGANTLFKWLFHLPRPYWYASEVDGLVSDPYFGAPSGHSQLSVSLYGLIASSIKRRWIWPAALIVIFLVSLSRIVLGVHFYFDILVGWILGFLILWLFLRYERAVKVWLDAKSLGNQIGIAFLISLIPILIGVIILGSLANFEIPTDWVANALEDQPAEPINPLNLEDILTSSAIFFGFASGALWLSQQGWFSAAGEYWQRLVRYIIGLMGVMILWQGLGSIFPSDPDLISYSLRYIRYTFVGFWMSGLAPWIFIRTRLAQKAN